MVDELLQGSGHIQGHMEDCRMVERLREENQRWIPYENADPVPCVDLDFVLPEGLKFPGREFNLKYGDEVFKVRLP